MDNEKIEGTGTSTKDAFEVLAGEVKALKDALEAAQKNADKNHGDVRSDDQEKIAKMEAEIVKLRKEADDVANLKRRGAYEVDEDVTQTRLITPNHIKSIIDLPSTKDSLFAQIQQANDEAYLGQVILGLKSPWQSSRLTDYLKSSYPQAVKSMNTSSSNQGPDWIPTGFSRSLIELVQLELKVASLHERFGMPTNPYTFPVEGADINAYVVPERTGDDDYVDATKFVTAATPGTANNTFTAKKVGVRSVFSGEITEDSILPILPYVRSKIVKAMAQAQDNTVINGDVRTTGGIDGNTSSTYQTVAYDGYRRAIQLAGTTYDCSTFNIANIRAARAGMGVYGVDTGSLCYVVSIPAYHKLLGLSEVITIDKFGSRATILNGQLGSIDGIPIVLSEYVSTTLDGAGANRGTSTKTEILLVRRDMFKFGDWRQITLKQEEKIETDQYVLVALQRLAFKSLFTASASQTFASALVNIS
jgi:HK97 family phage major capsid protein